jgi:hypothetical protein
LNQLGIIGIIGINKYGYNKPTSVYIPTDSADLTKDVLGNTLVNQGLVKLNANILGECGEYNGSSSKMDTGILVNNCDSFEFSAYAKIDWNRTTRYGLFGIQDIYLFVRLTETGRLDFQLYDGVNFINNGKGYILSSDWHFWKIKYTDSIKKFEVYIDGTLELEASNLSFNTLPASSMIIPNNGVNGKWNGLIHTVKGYINGNLVYYNPDGKTGYNVVVGGSHGTPTDVALAYSPNQLYNINYGMTLIGSTTDRITNPDLEIPYKLDGTPISDAEITTLFSGYARISNHPAINLGNVFGNNLSGLVDYAVDRIVPASRLANGKFIVGDWTTNTGWSIDSNGVAIATATTSIILRSDLTIGETYYYFFYSTVDSGNFKAFDGAVQLVSVSESGSHSGKFVASSINFYFDGGTAYTGTIPIIILYSANEILSEIGYKPFPTFNKLAFDGNSLNYPEYFEEEITHLESFDPAYPYRFEAIDLFWLLMAYGNSEVRASLLHYLKFDSNDNLIGFYNQGVYLINRTLVQMGVISKKGGWAELWDVFYHFHFHPQTELCIDLLRGDGNTAFLDASGNVSKELDWSAKRNHPVQGTAANRPALVKTVDDVFIDFDGSNDVLSFTNISLNEDFRIAINKKDSFSILIGDVVANIYLSQTTTFLVIRSGADNLFFADLGTDDVGVNCVPVIERKNGVISAYVIKADGTIVNSSTTYNSTIIFEFNLIGGYKSIIYASKQRQILFQSATAGNLVDLTTEQIKNFCKI